MKSLKIVFILISCLFFTSQCFSQIDSLTFPIRKDLKLKKFPLLKRKAFVNKNPPLIIRADIPVTMAKQQLGTSSSNKVIAEIKANYKKCIKDCESTKESSLKNLPCGYFQTKQQYENCKASSTNQYNQCVAPCNQTYNQQKKKCKDIKKEECKKCKKNFKSERKKCRKKIKWWKFRKRRKCIKPLKKIAKECKKTVEADYANCTKKAGEEKTNCINKCKNERDQRCKTETSAWNNCKKSAELIFNTEKNCKKNCEEERDMLLKAERWNPNCPTQIGGEGGSMIRFVNKENYTMYVFGTDNFGFVILVATIQAGEFYDHTVECGNIERLAFAKVNNPDEWKLITGSLIGGCCEEPFLAIENIYLN